MHTPRLSTHGLDLSGASLGGIETYLSIPQLRLAIDVGRGPRELVRCEHIALTHTHIDHAAGLPYLVAMRSFFRLAPPKIYAPEASIEHLERLVAQWNTLQGIEAEAEFIAMVPGRRISIRRDIELSAFQTQHRVPCLGYTLTKSVEKLSEAFKERAGHELGELKRQGVAITETQRQPLFSVTGDTLVEVLDDNPEILDSKILVTECTFLNDHKPYAAARNGGHIHLKDLMERADALRCEKLVLSHFSQLHKWEEIPELLAPLARAIPGELWAWPMSSADSPRLIAREGA